jgi:Lauroyl/myristoyl acyltransferase
MSKVVYIFAYIGIWLLAIMPFGLLYKVSDILYLLVYKIAGYRKRVVKQNLRNSFPEKSNDELKAIEHKFYHYICDYMLESMKMLLLPKTELLRRMKFTNTELYLEMIEKHGGIVVMMPHYANFEWTVVMGSFMKEGDIPMQVYKPIKNKHIDELFKYIRSRFGGYNVPKHDTIREVIKARNARKKTCAGSDCRSVS